ncbi:TetR family transcriptional regulator [Streptomyces sp. NPDC058280]|uniref:TetR/AcrR family transcriptional regulator n=1 Tax=Streptomyces sp. NPDC058280 TaxID=3346419 RepID=UPI0036ED6503
MSSPPSEFRRARRPEQVEARRRAILATARETLLERSLAEVSLRELSDRVGLAKSNVLRYFDSREAIFLEVLETEWSSWLDALESESESESKSGEGAEADGASGGPYAVEIRFATSVANTLCARPLLCELISAMAGVLERNISIGFARDFKQRAAAHTDRLAALVRTRLPRLDEAAAGHFAGAVFVITAGMWPYVNPTEAVATVTAEMGYPTAAEAFPLQLREGFITHLIGLTARAAS